VESVPAQPAPSATVQREGDRNFLKADSNAPARPVPPPSAAVPPTSAVPPPSGDAYAALYTRTPFSNAPREVQVDTLRRAQATLAKRGFYQGEINGIPGPDTDEALLRYQSAKHLPRTGKMDIDTLAELRLLPVSRAPFNPNHVYKGRVPRDFPDGEVPVRGIPVD
jgi:hypothetical protein